MRDTLPGTKHRHMNLCEASTVAGRKGTGSVVAQYVTFAPVLVACPGAQTLQGGLSARSTLSLDFRHLNCETSAARCMSRSRSPGSRRRRWRREQSSSCRALMPLVPSLARRHLCTTTTYAFETGERVGFNAVHMLLMYHPHFFRPHVLNSAWGT